MTSTLTPWRSIWLCWACAFAGCGAERPTSRDAAAADGGRADAEGSEEGAPVILSFGTSVSALTEGETVVFTAVLTDPDGIEDVIGGALKNADATTVYGAFATSADEGSYALTLTWETVDQAQRLEFIGDASRVFSAEFFDVAGHTVTADATIRFFCDTGAACGGTCTDVSTSGSDCGSCGHACAAGGGCLGGTCYEWSSCQDGGTTCGDLCTAEGRTCGEACLGSDPDAPRAVLHYMDLASCTGDPGSGASVNGMRSCDDPVFNPSFPFWDVEQCCCSSP